MNIICQRDVLSLNIGIVSKAVSTRTTVQILETILLKAENNEFILIANDLEMAIQTSPICAEIIEEGAVAINARMLQEIVKKLPDENINITVDKENVVEIKCGYSNFKIMGLSAVEFPLLPDIERNSEIVLKQSELRSLIRQTIFAIALTEDKPVFTGELFNIRNDVLDIVAVDGFRIAYRKTKIVSTVKNISVIIPGKTLNEISKILSIEDEYNVSLFIMDNHVLFDLGNCIVLSRVIDGKFINYDDMFTDDCDTLVKVDKHKFLMSLERASLVSRENKRTAIKIRLSNDCMIISSNTELGTAHEELFIDMIGNELEISFNPKFLIDALKVIDNNNISIQFTTSLSPCIIRVVDDEYFKYLVLPLRIK